MSMVKSVKLSGCQAVKFDPWDMLNNFSFHVYAPKSLFIAENDNAFLGPPEPHSIRVYTGDSHLKI